MILHTHCLFNYLYFIISFFSTARVYINTANRSYCCVLERAVGGLFHQSQSRRENRIFPCPIRSLCRSRFGQWRPAAHCAVGGRRLNPVCCRERGAKAICQNGRSDDTSSQVSVARFIFTTWHISSWLLSLRAASGDAAVAAKGDVCRILVSVAAPS